MWLGGWLFLAGVAGWWCVLFLRFVLSAGYGGELSLEGLCLATSGHFLSLSAGADGGFAWLGDPALGGQTQSRVETEVFV